MNRIFLLLAVSALTNVALADTSDMNFRGQTFRQPLTPAADFVCDKNACTRKNESLTLGTGKLKSVDYITNDDGNLVRVDVKLVIGGRWIVRSLADEKWGKADVDDKITTNWNDRCKNDGVTVRLFDYYGLMGRHLGGAAEMYELLMITDCDFYHTNVKKMEDSRKAAVKKDL